MNFDSQKPIYLQIAERIEEYILRGEWAEGERIASVRELGINLAVNPATVLRAYDELSSQDIIEQQRGIGYFVATGAKQKVQQLRQTEFIETTLPEIFNSMENLGITFEQLAALYSKHKGE